MMKRLVALALLPLLAACGGFPRSSPGAKALQGSVATYVIDPRTRIVDSFSLG
jgi:hypothetical protein